MQRFRKFYFIHTPCFNGEKKEPWDLENSGHEDDLGEAKKDDVRKLVEAEGSWCSSLSSW